tara:strand:+ start:401 stop:559 length:159 start_codon:yes stop_codon:yes gene_type:complete
MKKIIMKVVEYSFITIMIVYLLVQFIVVSLVDLFRYLIKLPFVRKRKRRRRK